MIDPAEEDLQIKRRMLELMEDSARRNSDNMQQINTNITHLTSTIQDGFSLLRELLLQRHSGADGGANTPKHWMQSTVKQEEE